MDRDTGHNPSAVCQDYLVSAVVAPWARLLREVAAPRPGERVLDLAFDTPQATLTLLHEKEAGSPQ